MGILALVLLILGLGVLGFFIFKVIKLAKNHEVGEAKYKIAGNERLLLLGLVCGVSLLLALAALFSAIHFKNAVKWWEFFLLIFGSIVAGAAVPFAVGGFVLFYYKLDLDDKQRNICKYAWPIATLAFFAGILILTEGIARNISYPLVSGISFAEGFITPNTITTSFTIKFYGIVIVTGALICYAITDHEMYKKFKQHGLIDTLFIAVFLIGIFGARFWYCVVLEPQSTIGDHGFFYLFTGIVDGGLAIQGGAIFGFITAIVFLRLFRKYIDIRFLIDVAAPTVLIAQAMGRWGNFFNQEVYGNPTTIEHLWYLPTIIKNNMYIGGQYRVPLFFIEGVMNIGGYFLIRYVVGKLFKAHLGIGIQGCSYLVWYGITRIALEPLREGFTLNLGSSEAFGYLQSWITAFAMFAIGIIGIVACYFIHKYRMKNGKENEFGDKIV